MKYNLSIFNFYLHIPSSSNKKTYVPTLSFKLTSNTNINSNLGENIIFTTIRAYEKKE